MCASVVAGVDASPVLDAGEHVLDFVALLVGGPVEGDVGCAAGPCGDAGFDPAHREEFAEPVCVVAFVSNQDFGIWKVWRYYRRPFEVAHLAFGQKQDQGPPHPVADSMELAIQPALGATDTAG